MRTVTESRTSGKGHTDSTRSWMIRLGACPPGTPPSRSISTRSRRSSLESFGEHSFHGSILGERKTPGSSQVSKMRCLMAVYSHRDIPRARTDMCTDQFGNRLRDIEISGH